MSSILCALLADAAAPETRNPIRTGAFCASATLGQATAVPPKSVINSRRRMCPPKITGQGIAAFNRLAVRNDNHSRHQTLARPMSENGMDRPCSRPASEHACVGQQKEHHAMPKSNTAVVTIGIDPGKNTLHLIGLDARGGIVLREKVARARIVSRLAHVPPCLIAIEAGMGTHYVTRELLALGHDVRQVPPVYAKPFRQTHKNDFRDALAIAEAVQRPTTRCVPPKTDEQLDLQALHRVRYRLVGQRTAIINQMRCFLLEHGLTVRQRLHWLRHALPDILAQRTDVL